MDAQRRLPWDWSDLSIPVGVQVAEGAYIESAYSFARYRSERQRGAIFEEESSTYHGCMFDLGPDAEIRVGAFTLLNGVWFISNDRITVGHHTLISWDVVIMDTPQWSRDPRARRKQLEHFAHSSTPRSVPTHGVAARPVTIGSNVWIGFGSIIMPGVTIGDGAVVGCRSVVFEDVAPYVIAAGNPATQIRELKE